MAIDLKCIEIKRGKDGSIFSAFLSDGNKTLEVSKEEIKIKLLKGYWKIDKLYLTSDNRLLERVKDTLISDYEESCKTLGIEPFKIIKVDNDYIIVDFPKNKNNLVVPDFVTRVYIDKRIGNSSNNVEVNQNKNLVSTFYSSSKEESFRKIDEIHLLLKSIYNGKVDLNQNIKSDIKKLENLLNEYLTKNISSEEEIKDKLDDVESLIQEFKDSELESDKELLKYLNEAKFVLQDTGVKVLELKSSLTPLFSNMQEEYIDLVQNSDLKIKNRKNLIDNLPKDAALVLSKSDYICLNENIYNSYLKNKRLNFFVVSYDKLECLADYYLYYEKMYDDFNLILKQRNSDEIQDIVRLLNTTSPIKHVCSFASHSIDTVSNLFFNENKVPKLFSNFIDSASSGIDVYSDVRKQLKLRKLRNECNNIFAVPENLQELFDINDKEVIKYLSEYYYVSYFGKYDNLDYNDLFHFYHISHKSNNNFTLLSEEERKRIAISYIITNKIMDKKVI